MITHKAGQSTAYKARPLVQGCQERKNDLRWDPRYNCLRGAGGSFGLGATTEAKPIWAISKNTPSSRLFNEILGTRQGHVPRNTS